MLLLILANNVPLQKHGLILSAISARFGILFQRTPSGFCQPSFSFSASFYRDVEDFFKPIEWRCALNSPKSSMSIRPPDSDEKNCVNAPSNHGNCSSDRPIPNLFVLSRS
jgi:hypothetical protein